MFDTVTTIVMEVIRILTFQPERVAPPRHRKAVVIPTSIDHDLCAQSRRPMDIIFQG